MQGRRWHTLGDEAPAQPRCPEAPAHASLPRRLRLGPLQDHDGVPDIDWFGKALDRALEPALSPLLAMLGLIAVLLGDLVREVEIKAIHGPEELPPPRRPSGRFAHLAGEDD